MANARRKRPDNRKKNGNGRGGRMPEPPRFARLRKWSKRIGLALLVLTALGVVGAATTLWYFGRDLPTVESLRSYDPPQITRVLDRDGELVGEVYTERRTVVPMERIPRALVLSVLAAEDADFYQHEGLDYPGLLRAIARAVWEGRRARGTSTITQQVVKLHLLTPEQTITRKIKELILARKLEQQLTKDEILHLYLNHINFGHGRYGAQEAARFYFDKDVEDLTLAEASLIAGIPQSPARLSPRTHREAAERRQAFVLDQLERKRERWPDLTVEEIQAARETEVELAPDDEGGESAPEVLVIARQVLREQVGEEACERGGYTVHTSVDLDLQAEARKALREGLQAVDARHAYRGPLEARRRRREPDAVDQLQMGRSYTAVVTGADDENGVLELDVGGHPAFAEIPDRYNPEDLSPSAFAEEGARVKVSVLHPGDETGEAQVRLELGPQGAAVVIDPRTRDVRALVGGYEEAVGFNRATQAQRQPGSSFKPIVYALGIESRRFTPATLVLDAPAVYEEWKPQNYERWSYQGDIRLREALARSINLVAVRVIEEVSPQETVSFAKQLGIESELEPSLGLALGASEVRPVELVNAYATFAAGGRWAPVRIVTRIEGPDGTEVPLPDAEEPRDVLTPAEAYVVTSMLTSVVQSGTASSAQRLGRPAAGKTGTSNEARDAWFVGYTPNVVAGVWVGFDDRRPLGRRESGGKAALPVWVDIVEAAEEGRPAVDFPVPSGVVTATIDPATGLLAYEGAEETIEEVFLEGTVPTETARPPDVADPNTFLMEQFGALGAPEGDGAEEGTEEQGE